MAPHLTNYDGSHHRHAAASRVAENGAGDPGDAQQPGTVSEPGARDGQPPLTHAVRGDRRNGRRACEHLTRVLRIDHGAGTITAEAGLQYIDAATALRKENLQFMLNIEIGNMTLGSAACCHTKDALDGIEFGQVGSYVTRVKWVEPARRPAGGERGLEPGSAAPGAIELRTLRHHLRSHAAGEAHRSGAVHLSAAAGPTSSRRPKSTASSSRAKASCAGRSGERPCSRRRSASRIPTCSRGSWRRDAGCCGTTSPRSGHARSINSSTAPSRPWRRIRPSGSPGWCSSHCR